MSMRHVALHLAEEFISEDLDYYFSTKRDKNRQIRPDENIYSMTPSSTHLSHQLNDAQVGNFFFPTQPNLLDRIYIGTSVPLFANNWGASFLLQLLKVLKPDGAIILPVYPEAQAQEKGYWSRSFLENSFLSRQRWTGFSNVRAENDGVMSLQVGRKWPEPIPSTVEWLYQHRSDLVLQELLEADTSRYIQMVFSGQVEKPWNNYTHSAVVEKIILDNYGARAPITLHNICDDYGLLVTELLLSPHINAISGITTDVSKTRKNIAHSLKNYFSPHTDGRHHIEHTELNDIDFHQKSNVICMLNVLSKSDKSDREILIDRAWQQLKPGGLLIVYEDLQTNSHLIDNADLHKALSRFGDIQVYSTIVASRIQTDVDISHYSSIQETRLLKEKRDQDKVFRMVKK